MTSFEPGSIASIDGCRRSHMPPAAPTRMARKDAIKATVELMVFSACCHRAGSQAYSLALGQSNRRLFPRKSFTHAIFVVLRDWPIDHNGLRKGSLQQELRGVVFMSSRTMP